MSDPDDPLIGRTIDGCQLMARLATGDRSLVYLASGATGQCVIKILRPDIAGGEATVERFFREAQVMAQLTHPGLPAIQNVGQAGEYYFIRVELIDGETAEASVERRGPFSWREAATIGAQVAETLAHVHQKGMIHRQVAPSHLMLTGSRVKLIGWGLTKHVHSAARVSVTGQIVGLPMFMSPEQAGGKPTDARSDVYSLGCTLYYLLAGVRPFNGKNVQEIFLKHFFYMPESPRIYQPDIPEPLALVVRTCLNKKKLERFQAAQDLARELQTIAGSA